MGLGRVYLIGAGPGAPDLLTIRALRTLRDADLVIQDALLPADILDQAGVNMGAKKVVLLGESASTDSQEKINEMMLAAAEKGLRVARLKTGDPFVFGRGCEESEFLAGKGVAVEIVPGLSSATAGAAGAWMALSRRGESRSFAVLSARREGGKINDSWPKADNLVVLMAMEVLDEVVKRLQSEGWDAKTPAALIERASLPWERRVYSSLEKIGNAAIEERVSSPAILVVGPAAGRGVEARKRPVVIYTGFDPTNFRMLGDIIHWPALSVLPDESGRAALSQVLAKLAGQAFDCVIFTSRLGVNSFFAALTGAGLDCRILAGKRLVAAGAGTEAFLSERGLRADAVPVADEAGSAGILQVIGNPRSVLLVQGSHAPADLCEKLAERGVRAERLSLHRITPNPELGRPLPRHDMLYFTSPSGAKAFLAVYAAEEISKEIWCIGSVTRDALAALGLKAKVVSPY